MDRQTFNATIAAFLKGEDRPSDAHVAYSLEKLRAARAEHSLLGERIAALEAQLTAAKQRRLALQGEVDSRAGDIEHWMGLEEKESTNGKRAEESGPRTEKGLGGVHVTDKRSMV